MAQLTKDEFYDLWLTQVKKGFGYMESYDNAEIIHFREYGKFRYADYDSFRKVRDYKK